MVNIENKRLDLNISIKSNDALRSRWFLFLETKSFFAALNTTERIRNTEGLAPSRIQLLTSLPLVHIASHLKSKILEFTPIVRIDCRH